MTEFDADLERQRNIEAARAEAYRGVGRLEMTAVMPVACSNHLVGVGVTFDDRLIVVSSDADPSQTFAARYTAEPGGASFPLSAAPTPYSIDVDIVADAGFRGDGDRDRRRLDGISIAHPQVQVCANGELLVVGSRSRLVDGVGEPNAFVYDLDGAVRTSFCIGDGVEHVQVTPSDRVWVGYFDEGVFGNLGWGSGAEPLGSAGVVCWSLTGERRYEFSPPGGFDRIIDCYAMNVADETVWVYYDSALAIVQIDANFGAIGWECGVEGATSIAVGDGRVALVGGYRGLFDRIVVFDIDANRRAGSPAPELVERQIFQLAGPDGADLPADTKIVARGRFVHAIVDGRWLRLDMSKPMVQR